MHCNIVGGIPLSIPDVSGENERCNARIKGLISLPTGLVDSIIGSQVGQQIYEWAGRMLTLCQLVCYSALWNHGEVSANRVKVAWPSTVPILSWVTGWINVAGWVG